MVVWEGNNIHRKIKRSLKKKKQKTELLDFAASELWENNNSLSNSIMFMS